MKFRRKPLAGTPGFPGMAYLSSDGTATLLLGELRTVPALSPAQWSLLRQRKTLLTTVNDEQGLTRLFLVEREFGHR
jgi:hypothetical protein